LLGTAKQNLTKKTNIKTFFRLINLPVPEDNILKKFNSFWQHGFLHNKMREFVFKFQHNLLGLNTRVSHFNENVPRSCTFCLVNPNNQQPIPDETFLHLFFDCKFTQIVRRQFINQFLFDLNLNDVTAEKNFFFLSINPSSGKNDNLFISLISRLFMFFIWQCKLNKKLPTISNLLNDIFFG
jgi:hypothetical protein